MNLTSLRDSWASLSAGGFEAGERWVRALWRAAPSPHPGMASEGHCLGSHQRCASDASRERFRRPRPVILEGSNSRVRVGSSHAGVRVHHAALRVVPTRPQLV